MEETVSQKDLKELIGGILEIVCKMMEDGDDAQELANKCQHRIRRSIDKLDEVSIKMEQTGDLWGPQEVYNATLSSTAYAMQGAAGFLLMGALSSAVAIKVLKEINREAH